MPGRLRQRGFQAFDQGLSVEGLAQEAGCARFQRPVAVAFDRESGDKDEGGCPASGKQVILQVEPAHSRHSDVGYHAGCIVEVARYQEIFGGGKGMDDIAKRPDEICGGGADRAIVVDNRYDLWVGQRRYFLEDDPRLSFVTS